MKRTICAVAAVFFAGLACAQEPTMIRFGRGFAAEEQVWLMSARPDLAPNQGKKYQLKQILFQANPERFQAFLAGEAAGQQWFSTTYMVKDDGPVKTVKDLKDGTIGVVGYKTATDLWARAGLLNAGLVPDQDTKLFSLGFPAMGDSVRTNKIQAGTFVEPFYSAE